MRGDFRLAKRAISDLKSIWQYVHKDNPDAAHRLLEEFYQAFRALAKMPRIGHTRRDLTSRDVLFWSLRSYLIIYQRTDTPPLQVVRVLHAKRDVTKLLM